jgi:hemolysin III
VFQRPLFIFPDARRCRDDAELEGMETTYPTYTRSERVADGSMHAIGVTGAVLGAILLLVWSVPVASPWEITAITVYAITLIGTFTASAFYHMTPWENLRPALRRIDHAAIYLKIAGTYTPLVVMIGSGLAYAVLGIIWALAVIGMVLKLVFWSAPGQFGPALYLIMGWMSVVLFWSSWSELPFGYIVAGGLLYTVGVVFYAAKNMKFSNAIWHGFVIAASACFFVAITVATTQQAVA